MDVENPTGKRELTINSYQLATPYQATQYSIIGDKTVVSVFNTWNPTDISYWEELGFDMGHRKRDPDFELGNPFRNVVAFDLVGDLLWEIPEPPHPAQEDDEPYYKSVWTADDELWVRNKNQRSYRVDPADGTLLEDIPADQFRLGGQTIEFDRGWVDQVIHHDDLVIVRLDGSGHPGPSGKNIYVFDQDGTRRWWIGERLAEDPETPAPSFTNIWIEDGRLGGYAVDGYKYWFDPNDGTLLDQKWVK